LTEATDPERTVFPTGAVRSSDADAVRFDLISPVGLRRLAAVYAEGAKEYGVDNWRKGMPFSDLTNHGLNHMNKEMAGDRSEDHLAKLAWMAFTMMDLQENMPEMDDRHVAKKSIERKDNQ
jgi:hypothetical protein